MWVSTAKVSAPKAQFITTLAVLRPTPGRVVSTSRSAGTSPPKSRQNLDRAMTFFALELNRPMVLMCALSPSSPSDHLRRSLHLAEQRARRLVDADVGRLRGQHHGDQQLIGIAEFQLRLGRGVGFGKTAEELENVVLLQSPSTSGMV
jgi:hypothetical protein